MPTVLLAAHAMGTRFELVLVGEDPIRLRAAGEEALREIHHWHDRLSRFTSDSDITRLNLNAHARIGPDLADLLVLAEEVRHSSDGAFDIHCGPNHTLDLGAIAKGFALDRAAIILQDCNIENALLHGGTSSVIALGSPGGAASPLPWASAHGEHCEHDEAAEGRKRGWQLQLRSNGEPLNIALSNQALGLSAPRGRILPNGHTHILDPRTNLPAQAADTAAIIAALSPTAATLADAWSTALIVLAHRPPTLPANFTSHIHKDTGWLSSVPSSDFPLPSSPSLTAP
jgi:thiamine biosynthesis lipoprotein